MGLDPLKVGSSSDAALIARSDRDSEAFSAIVDRHFAVIHGYLSRRVGTDRADDLAAQTFAVAYGRRRDFNADAASARPWLFGIATNLLRNEQRSERRLRSALARLDGSLVGGVDDAARALERIDAAGEIAKIAGAIAALESGQRDVLLLHAWAELSQSEIAESLEIPVGTVNSRLSRARAHLRSALNSVHPAEPLPAKEMNR